MIDVALYLPAAYLHEAFSNRSGLPPDRFELYYRGRRLENEAAISSCGIEKDSTIEVKMRGRGGTRDVLPAPARRGGGKKTDKDAEQPEASSSGASTKKLDEALEELQTVKAKTMYEMVDDVTSSTKVMFLTNSQAEVVAKSMSSSLKLMLDALGFPKPNLVISLLPSGGFRPWLNAFKDAEDLEESAPGCRPNQPPFLNPDDEHAALQRLDRFMADVLIPIAAKTNAIILCEGIGEHGCVLTSALTKMYTLMRSKWGSRPPFSILSMTCYTPWLYYNANEDAYWRTVMRASTAWTQRNPLLKQSVESMNTASGKSPAVTDDLDPDASCLLLVDTYNKDTKKVGDESKFQMLKTELLRQLSSSLPSLALRAGGGRVPSSYKDIIAACSLGPALEAVHSGVPLIFLDVRERKRLFSSDRKKRIRAALDKKDQLCKDLELLECKMRHKPLSSDRKELIQAAMVEENQLRIELLEHEPPLANNFYISSLAGMHEALKGDGDPSTTETAGSRRDEQLPLHEAIRQMEEKEESGSERNKVDYELKKEGSNSSDWPPPCASEEEIADAANWLARKYFESVDQLNAAAQSISGQTPVAGAGGMSQDLCDDEGGGTSTLNSGGGAGGGGSNGDGGGGEHRGAAEEKARLATRSTQPERQDVQASLYRSLLSSPDVHCCNIANIDSARQLLKHIAKLDRLPTETSLRGLLLLHSAWCQFDVAMLLARRYKHICKVLMASQLLVGWAVVLFGTVASLVTQFNTPLVETVFIFSVISSIILGIEGLLSAKARWFQLRASAGALESIIWYAVCMRAFAACVCCLQPSPASILLPSPAMYFCQQVLSHACRGFCH